MTIVAVHGFTNTTYNVVEGDRLHTHFQFNVKGETALGGALVFSGRITTASGGTASEQHANNV